ncbi:MAG: AEC family transporter, partial [Bacillota bacterium]|nr:AEC family transporter [Bacillota bacterium]
GIGIAKIMGLDKMLCMAVLIPAACPTATVTTLFAARFKLDAAYSAEIVSITTVLSIITIPIIVMLV